MTVLVSDSFNRVNSTTGLGVADTGQTWQSLLGVWGIKNNQAYKVATTTGTIFAAIESGASDVQVTATKIQYDPSSIRKDSGITFRVTDSNNFYVFRWNVANLTDVLQLYKFQSGSGTLLGSYAMEFTPSTIYTFKVVANGSSIKCYVNDVEYISVTNTFNQTATQHGLRQFEIGEEYTDSFIVESLATGTLLTLSLSDSITLSDSETSMLTSTGILTKLLSDSISITDSISIKSTRFLSLVDSITTSESFTKRRQAYLSLVDGLTISDTETSTKTTINTLVRALSDSINITDSITIRAMRYLTIFDLFSIVDSIGTTGGGNVAQTIKFKRGNEVDLPTLAEGEPAITMDTNKMFVGTPNGNRQIATLLVVDSVANLPIAEKSKQFLISGVLGGTGTADALYVCKKLSNDTYDWVQFV